MSERFVGQLPGTFVVQHRLDHEIEVAGKNIGEAVDREPDAVIGDPILLVVVRADLLAATATADLGAALADISALCSRSARSKSRARNTCIARARFCNWLRSSCMVTTRPLGLCVTRTAESVVFTLCPPAADDRYTSTSMSLSSMTTSTSSASGSTATVADDV